MDCNHAGRKVKHFDLRQARRSRIIAASVAWSGCWRIDSAR